MKLQLKNVTIAALAIVGWAVSSLSLAHDFAEADAAFQERGGANGDGDLTKIGEAKQKYVQAIDSGITGEDLVYAVEQHSRLCSYEISLTPESDSNGRKSIAVAGLKQLEKIAPAKISKETPQYYYWHALLLSRRAQAEGPFSQVANLPAVTKSVDKGDALNTNYEGGGFRRLRGQIQSKTLAIGGSASKAETELEAATNAPAYDLEKDEAKATESGAYFYSVFFYRAENLCKSLKKRDEALAILKGAVARLELDDDYPVKRVPEVKYDLKQMKDLLGKMEADSNFCK